MKHSRRWRMVMRVIGLLAFVATGGGLIVSTVINQGNYYKTEILMIFGALFAVSLIDHFLKLLERDD